MFTPVSGRVAAKQSTANTGISNLSRTNSHGCPVDQSNAGYQITGGQSDYSWTSIVVDTMVNRYHSIPPPRSVYISLE